MVCSSCGYDNPGEHRYCGMCGTPFPHRPLTVPDAQSTLSFSSAPLEVAPVPLPIQSDEPPQVISASPIETPEPPLETQPIEPALPAEAEVPSPAPLEPSVQAAEPAPIHHDEGPTPVAEELFPEASPAAEAAPVIEPPPPIIEGHAPASVVAEPILPTPEKPRQETPSRIRENHEPPRPAPHLVMPPGPRLAPKPVGARREPPTPCTDAVPRRHAPPHPSPDSIPITLPPASAGMPTYQSVAEAAGPPAISPFKPPAEKHSNEDPELREFIANFRYTPPDETTDELTMRSEAPVIDEESPTEFHHASFDGDQPPPPEAGAHPTGQEFYPPTAGFGDRSRFLEIADSRPVASDHKAPPATGTSFLGLDDSAPAAPPITDAPARGRWLLWSSLLALLAIFGGLGFLEGRAQLTHDFRGPVEITRDQYEKLRQRISQMSAPAPAATPAAPAPQPENQTSPPSEPASPNSGSQTPAASNPQPDNSAQPASSTPPATAPATGPANSEVQPQQVPSANQQTASATDNTQTTPATDNTNYTAAAPADNAKAEPPKPASKPQPGQHELARALGASDPAAEAAWLWKATSRGNPEAPVRLADMYIKGKGVPRSCEQALVLLRSAALKQNAPALNRLAALYANGTCVARDPVRAYQLMSSALDADPTSEWAEQNRKDLWNRMTPAQRVEAEKYH